MRFTIKPKKRSAVSPVIATLLLIAIAVAAAIIVYAFVTGLIGGLTSSGASLVVVSGSLTVPTGSGAGTLVITVNNKASNAINAVTVATDPADTAMSVSFAAQNGVGPLGVNSVAWAGGPAIPVLCNSGEPVGICTASATPQSIPIGTSASAIGSLSAVGGATAGTTYTFTISSYIGSSTTPNIQTFSVTAQI